MADIQREALGQALTTHMTVRSRYDAAKALVHSQFPESDAFATINGLQNKVTSELAGKRNDIVHSRLHGIIGQPRPYRVVYKARGKVRKNTIRVDLDEYETVAADILVATNQLIDALNELVDLVTARDGAAPPWTERP